MNDPRKRPAPESADRHDRDARGEAELDVLRRDIDRADRAILEQLNRRAALVQRVGERKRRDGVGIYDAARERSLVAALQDANPGPFPAAGVGPVFREIVSATRSLEGPLRVAFLGPEATFSHLAAREVFGAVADYQAVGSFAEVFAAVERGDVQHGVVPVENTSEGVVTATLDLLAHATLPICGERLLPIHHQLLARGGSLADIERVASHPQPLAQCRGWLERHLPDAERVEMASTTAAAEAATREPGTAAIASRLAAEVSKLEILATDIEDRRDNTTRFLVIGGDAPEPSGDDVTLAVFTVHKTRPGALHGLLAPFARHGVNLAAIQSRPQKDTPWEYLFFLDLEGHVAEPAVATALREAAEEASSCRVLGSFPRAASTLARPTGRPGAAGREGA